MSQQRSREVKLPDNIPPFLFHILLIMVSSATFAVAAIDPFAGLALLACGVVMTVTVKIVTGTKMVK